MVHNKGAARAVVLIHDPTFVLLGPSYHSFIAVLARGQGSGHFERTPELIFLRDFAIHLTEALRLRVTEVLSAKCRGTRPTLPVLLTELFGVPTRVRRELGVLHVLNALLAE